MASKDHGDPIPEHYTPSIYHRFDYIVNSDMSRPFALARTWNYGVDSELTARTGLPENSRAPEFSPLVLRMPILPKGR